MDNNINNSIIKIIDLTKIYNSKKRKVTALDHIDLEVYKGDIFGFIGPNGAGKTTTIRIITGITTPTSGIVEISGYDVAKNPIEVKKMIGAVPEEIGFYNTMTGRDILEYHAEFYGDGEYKKNIDQIARKTEIDGYIDRKVKGYSFGMKKKLALSQALINEPELLILDEPTLALDPKATHFFIKLIKELNKDGLTIFLSSHILPVVEKLCNRIGIINDGKILRVDDLDKLSEKLDAEKSFIEVYIEGEGFDENTMDEIQKIREVRDITKKSSEIKVISIKKYDAVYDISSVLMKNDVRVKSVKIDEPCLEDFFLKIIDGDKSE